MSINVKYNPKKINLDLSQWTEARKADLRKQIARSANEIEAEAKTLVPVGVDGTLRASINTKYKKKGYEAEIGPGALEGKSVIYAEIIEFGRKPGGFPPWQENTSLWRWVKLKMGITGKLTKAVAFMIARKIAREGFAKHPYLKPAFDHELPNFKKALFKIFKKTKKKA
jgi:hypothetical protein